MSAVSRIRRSLQTHLWSLWPPEVLDSSESPSASRVRRYVRALNSQERRLSDQVSSDPAHLHRFERSEHSQNGEDGIIAEIFARLGAKNRSFVEIGASDGEENCTRALVEQGWSGVWVEGDSAKAAAARHAADTRPVAVAEVFVDRDSVLPALRQAGASASPDLLVIDVDGNDYWVWETVDTCHHARVVVIEYNAVVGPWLNWVMPYNPRHRWDETRRHGAGLAALARLGSSMGYRLVGCDSHGVNAFFVVSSQSQSFSHRSVRDHYVGPRYGLPFGHPRHAYQPFQADPVPEGESRGIRLEIVPPGCTEVRPLGLVYVDAVVHNGTSVPIGSSRSTPVQLAGWWLGEDGLRLCDEPERSTQHWRAEPGATVHLVGRVTAPDVPGHYTLVFGLVQESVCWFDGPGASVTVGSLAVR
jgi:hypothetical protein